MPSGEGAPLTILVTGGTGLVGSAVQHVVTNRKPVNETWVFVGSRDADLTRLEQADSLFEKVKPTHVLHLAARVGGLFANQSDNLGFYKDNMMMQDNMYTCAAKFGVKKMVSCLSTCVFPDKVTYPISEEDLHNGPPHDSNAGYAYAKRMVDVQNRLYNGGQSQENKCLFTAVIPTNAYGENDNFNLQTGHVIASLIRKCHTAKVDNQPFVVAGTGEPLRQFLYSYDLGRLLVWAVMIYKEDTPIILADEKEYTIADVAQTIAEVMEFDGPVTFNPTMSNGQHRKTVSIAKLRTYLPNFVFTDLHVGLKKSVTWFMRNQDHIRE